MSLTSTLGADLLNQILVTGAAGYIGSALVRLLLDGGARVTAADSLAFGGESILPLLAHPNFRFVKCDVRQPQSLVEYLRGTDAVVHLAGIVGDPACARDPELAKSVNLEATKSLYELCDAAGVDRFVFASTCSNYGKMEDPNAFVTEESRLAPISVYAETKVAAEEFLLGQPRTRHCKPTCLRFSTVFGLSPRVRFDLTVNDFTKELTLGRELLVFGEQFWRPYCHVIDLARAVVLTLQSDERVVAFDVFNVGDDQQNYTKGMIVELLKQEIPTARIRYVSKDEDPRDYRVTFRKIQQELEFRITRTVLDGIRETHRVLRDGFILDPDAPKYYNVPPQPAKAA